MARDPRYDILFEPVAIGPKTARNRFYQVPHCNGMGWRDGTQNATMRGIKAEGGWAVVCTEEVEIHPSSEVTPYVELRLWDDRDLPLHERIVEAIHAHGSLAGIELCHQGPASANNYSREVPFGPHHLPTMTAQNEQLQARAFDKTDMKNLRRWHRNAARRSMQAGYDLVYVYAGHGLAMAQILLSRHTNQRSDEYGGTLENRVRFLRELIEDTKEAVGDRCGVPVRIAVEEMLGDIGLTNSELKDVIGLIGELPDLWDFCMGTWAYDSQSSRFSEEGFQDDFVRGLKALTSKPVVGVGRFTSVDKMVKQVKSGMLDFIGAARPSIADPFLPKKIEEGRIEDIRECIGCNVCVTGDSLASPSRCTQNATFGDEWRRGWHPEKFARRGSETRVLIVGGGPAGLEAARVAAMRGYEVALAEAGDVLGGRVAKERRLPGLSAWGRVADYRTFQLSQLANVETYLESRLTADDILSFGFEHVAVATGATWRRDSVGRFNLRPIEIAEAAPVFTPDDVLEGRMPQGRVIIYDDDHYYMAGVLAELLTSRGASVTIVTPSTMISDFTQMTLEQKFIQRRLLEAGVNLRLTHGLEAIARDHLQIACVYTGNTAAIEMDAVLMVTARLPNDQLALELGGRRAEWKDRGILSVRTIGDCLAAGTIAHAVYSGHRFSRQLDREEDPDTVSFRREVTQLDADFPQSFG
ncbi:MAG TPA: FAD-dependent oxidoreductase [Aestuariivirgaceae bacterium]|jgi:dimethylamine/trimethylamine dehydrogenase